MNQVVHKVVAYITCQDHLLVFAHRDNPEAGIQVPGGTIAQGESPDSAVLREAFEETGLSQLRIESFLGTRTYDMMPITGQALDIHRHYYHLSAPAPIVEGRWLHWETSPSEGPPDPIAFELFWVAFPD
jgi:8-oxo-dGTP pyrophosphatase MutT (NUDIX family)